MVRRSLVTPRQSPRRLVWVPLGIMALLVVTSPEGPFWPLAFFLVPLYFQWRWVLRAESSTLYDAYFDDGELVLQTLNHKRDESEPTRVSQGADVELCRSRQGQELRVEFTHYRGDFTEWGTGEIEKWLDGEPHD